MNKKKRMLALFLIFAIILKIKTYFVVGYFVNSCAPYFFSFCGEKRERKNKFKKSKVLKSNLNLNLVFK